MPRPLRLPRMQRCRLIMATYSGQSLSQANRQVDETSVKCKPYIQTQSIRHTHTRTHTHTYTYAHLHTPLHKHTNLHTHARTQTRTHTTIHSHEQTISQIPNTVT